MPWEDAPVIDAPASWKDAPLLEEDWQAAPLVEDAGQVESPIRLVDEEAGTLGGLATTAKIAGKNVVQSISALRNKDAVSQLQRERAVLSSPESLADFAVDPRGGSGFSRRNEAQEKIAQLQPEVAQFAQGFTQRDKEIQALTGQLSPAMKSWNEAKGFDAVKAFASDPFEITSNIMLGSIIQSVPALAGGAVGSAAGPAGTAAGVGAGSYAAEYANKFLDVMREQAVDPTDPKQVEAAFSNPEFLAKAQQKANARGIPVALFDAATAGIAGRFLKPALGSGAKAVVKATAKEIGTQAVGGAAGEAVAQQAAGEEFSGKDIFAEALGEIAGGPSEILGNLRQMRSAKVDTAGVAPKAVESLSPAISSPTPAAEENARIRTVPAPEVAAPLKARISDAPPALATAPVPENLQTSTLPKQSTTDAIEAGAKLSTPVLPAAPKGTTGPTERAGVESIDTQIDHLLTQHAASGDPQQKAQLFEQAKALQQQKDAAALPTARRVKLKSGPQTYAVLEALPQSEIEKQNGEQYYVVSNEKTGQKQVVEAADMQDVKAGAKRAKAPSVDEQLRKRGFDPTKLNPAEKKALLRREKNKGGFVNGEIAAEIGQKLYLHFQQFADWSRAILRRLGQQVRPMLRQLWRRLTGADRLTGIYDKRQGGAIGSAGGSRANQDADYMAAVERGDMATAQRMVDEAAAAAGYGVKGWHGRTGGAPDFKAFDKAKIRHSPDTFWKGFFFAGREDDAFENAKPFFLRMRNPANHKTAWKISEEAVYSDAWPSETLRDGQDAAVALLKERGYDGVSEPRRGGEGARYTVFEPEQIKSADPITRDASGGVIPLSERFNPNSDSILYSDPLMLRTMMESGRLLYRAGMTFAQWLKRFIAKVGQAGKPYAQYVWRSITGADRLNPKQGAVNIRGNVPAPGSKVPLEQAREKSIPVAENEAGEAVRAEGPANRQRNEYATRVAERDLGTLSDFAWQEVRNRTTLPDTFKDDIDWAAQRIEQIGDLQAALDFQPPFSQSVQNLFSGATDRKRAALYFTVAQQAARQRANASSVLEKQRLLEVESEAIARFSDLASQGGKTLNIVGQLYQQMPKSPEAQVRAAEKALARMTGGEAAKIGAEKAKAEVDRALDKAGEEAATGTGKPPKRDGSKSLRRQLEEKAAKELKKAILNGNPTLQEDGPLNTADKASNGELKRILRQALGPDANTQPKTATAQQLALAVGLQDDLTQTKIDLLEQKMQGKVPAELQPAWDSIISALRETVASNQTLDRILGEQWKKEKNSLYNTLRSGNREAWKKQFRRIVELALADIPGATPQTKATIAELLEVRLAEREQAQKERLLDQYAKRSRKERASMEELWRLWNLGALDSDTAAQVFQNAAKVKEFTPAFREKLRGMYEKAESLPEGSPRNRELAKIALELGKAHPKTFSFWWNLLMSISYANILGAWTTLFVNNPVGAAVSQGEIGLNLALLNLTKPEVAKGMARAWAKSISDGFRLGIDLLRTGENMQKVNQFDSSLVMNPTELIDEMAQDATVPMGNGTRRIAKAIGKMKYIPRLMMASDANVRWPAREAFRFALSAETAREQQQPGESLQDAVDRLYYPGGRQQALTDAKAQAQQELADGILQSEEDVKLRTIELLQMKLSPEAQSDASEADDLANIGGLLADPVDDMVGAVQKSLMRLTFPGLDANAAQKVLAAGTQPFVRFVRTGGNMFRLALDFATGYGAWRYAFRRLQGKHPGFGEGKAQDAYAKIRVLRAFEGLAAYAVIGSLIAANWDDDDPWFDVIGAGPVSGDERKRLRDSGVQFNSVRIGNRYVGYSSGVLQPLAMVLGAFGRLRDNQKWPKGEKVFDEREAEAAHEAMLKGLLEGAGTQSITKGLADLMMIATKGETSIGEKWDQFLGRNAAQFIPGNFRGLSQIDEAISGPKEKGDGFGETLLNSIAFYAPNGRAVTILGDEVSSGKSGPQRMAEIMFKVKKLDDDPTLRFVVDTGMTVPDRERRPSDGKLQTYEQYNKMMREAGTKMRSWIDANRDKMDALPAEAKTKQGNTTHPRRNALNLQYRKFRAETLKDQ